MKWSEVKWSEVKWSEEKWSEVKWRVGNGCKNDTLWEKVRNLVMLYSVNKEEGKRERKT